MQLLKSGTVNWSAVRGVVTSAKFSTVNVRATSYRFTTYQDARRVILVDGLDNI